MTIYKFDGFEIDTTTLSADDMPTEVFREIFEICGVEVAVSLLYYFTGVIIQVPTRGMCNFVKKKIHQEYDGTTASLRAMARKFRMSEMNIREVLNEYKIQTPSPNQQSFKLF